MKLEDQVTSLEISKRLKELGVKQDSVFYWEFTKEGYEDGTQNPCLEYPKKYPTIFEGLTYILYSAYTVAELGEILHEPNNKDLNKYYPNAFRTLFKEKHKRWVIGDRYPLSDGNFTAHGKSETDCRGLLLIYLLKNKLIKRKS